MSRVAIRYGKALFETALQQNKLEIVLSDLRHISDLAEKDDRLSGLFQNPLIQANRKLKIIREVFYGHVDELTFRFLSLVTQKKRINLLLEMIEQFADRIDAHKGVVNGELITAAPVTPDQVNEIRSQVEKFTGRQVRLSARIDEQLIGGFVVRVRDTVIDLSVNGQLEKLRSRLALG